MKMVTIEVDMLVDDDVDSNRLIKDVGYGLVVLKDANELPGVDWYDVNVISEREMESVD